MILIGGGSRSGKSTAALRMLALSGPRQAFIATAQASDDEMADRIARHKAEREPQIQTWEEPIAIADRLQSIALEYDGIVVDCLTLWLSNLMMSGATDLLLHTRHLMEAAANAQSKIILITNEVGCGIVPDNSLARRFRDEQGWLNQAAAAQAAEVYWMVFGIAVRIK